RRASRRRASRDRVPAPSGDPLRWLTQRHTTRRMGRVGTGMVETAIYHCPACGAQHAADRPRWRCDCGGHLNLGPGHGLGRGDIVGSDASLWRYRAALAAASPPRVTLGEGWTPLVERRWDGAPVLFKL